MSDRPGTARAWRSAAGDDAPSASFVVELAHFSGPLDLLLTLLREEQIDIYDIPIARIAEQFLVRIRTLRLDEAAEYLEMAARLLRIKAQMLLPRRDGDEAWDDPRAELVRRLLEYQQVREVVDVLERRAAESGETASPATGARGAGAAFIGRAALGRAWPTCWRPSIACCARRAGPTSTRSSPVRSTSPAP